MKKISVSLLALTLLTSGCGGDKKAPSPSVAESPEPPPYVLVGTQEYCDPQDGVVIRANIYSDDGGKTTTRSGIELLGLARLT